MRGVTSQWSEARRYGCYGTLRTTARGNFPSKSGHEDMNTPHAWHKNHAHGAQQCLEPRHAAHTVQDGAQETACSGVRVALASTRQAAAHLFMEADAQ